MKRIRYTEEQIVKTLQEVEAGAETREVCRKIGITEQTFYRWRAKYGGLQVAETRRLRALEEENRRLKRLVADLSLDNQVLRDVNSKKW